MYEPKVKDGSSKPVLNKGEELTTGCFVGIDVSKNTLDVFVRPSGRCWTQPNEDYSGLCEELRQLNPTLIVLECGS